MRSSKARLAAAALSLAALVLGGLLVRRRQAARQSEDSYSYMCGETRQPFFVPEKSGSGFIVPGRRGTPPFRFRKSKSKNLRRVFVVGPSVAQFLARYFDAWSPLVRALAGSDQLEIINCGMPAYNSFRMLDIVREIRAYRPDAVVVLSGNHEDLHRDICPPPEIRLPLTELERTYQADPEAYEPTAQEWDLDVFARNLRAMAAAARGVGAKTVFCTLPACLRDCPPVVDARLAVPAPDLRPGSLARSGAWLEKRLRASPHNALLSYFLARTRDLAGDKKAARKFYRRAVDDDFNGGRCSPRRNALIREVARGEGAGLADLEAVFTAAAADGLPDGSMFTDDYHWSEAWDFKVNCAVAAALADLAPNAARARRRVRAACAQPRNIPRGQLARLPMDTPGGPEQDARTRILSLAVDRLASRRVAGSDRDEIDEKAISYLDRLESLDPAWLRRTAGRAHLERLLLRDWLGHPLQIAWPQYLYHLGEMHRRRGDPAAALEWFDQAARAGLTEAPLFLVHRGRARAALGDESAAADFRKAWARAGPLAASRRDYIRQSAWLAGVQTDFPDNGGPASRTETPAAPADAADAGRCIDQAYQAWLGKDADAARRALSRAAELAPGLDERHRMARLYGALGDHGQALALLQDLVRTSPRAAGLWLDLAEMAGQAGRPGASLEAAIRAEKLPTAGPEKHRLALLRQQLGDLKKALVLFEQSSRQTPGSARIRADLGVCRFLSGDAKGAAADLRRAIELDPRLLAAYRSLGAVLLDRRRPRQALEVYDLALARNRRTRDPMLDELRRDRREALARLKD
ncbi:MAG: hypothetical protein PHF00_06390 [Elusimicrobia bacterium]|nr:hypothetical protein [Elusimicrobiota bacterium]